MEDLWLVQDSGIDVDDLADSAEFKRLLERFREVEEQYHRRKILFQEETTDNPLAGECK